MLRVHREELKKTKPACHESWVLLKGVRRLMVREATLLDDSSRKWLHQALECSHQLKTVHMMKEKLAQVWKRSATTQEHLVHALQEWCHEAEATGIDALRMFARKLRTYRLAASA